MNFWPNFQKMFFNEEQPGQKKGTCLALVNGEPVSLVKRSSAVDLMEAIGGIVLN